MDLSPLLQAAKNGNLDNVKKALKGGADVNETAKNGTSALILASEEDHEEVVKYLIDKGADPDLSTTMGGRL